MAIFMISLSWRNGEEGRNKTNGSILWDQVGSGDEGSDLDDPGLCLPGLLHLVDDEHGAAVALGDGGGGGRGQAHRVLNYHLGSTHINR